MIDGPVVKKILVDNLPDHLLHDQLSELLHCLLGGSHGNDDRVHTKGNRSVAIPLVLKHDPNRVFESRLSQGDTRQSSMRH